jgi:hypothetical protein
MGYRLFSVKYVAVLLTTVQTGWQVSKPAKGCLDAGVWSSWRVDWMDKIRLVFSKSVTAQSDLLYTQLNPQMAVRSRCIPTPPTPIPLSYRHFEAQTGGLL